LKEVYGLFYVSDTVATLTTVEEDQLLVEQRIFYY
jgi:hypothetical protein